MYLALLQALCDGLNEDSAANHSAVAGLKLLGGPTTSAKVTKF